MGALLPMLLAAAVAGAAPPAAIRSSYDCVVKSSAPVALSARDAGNWSADDNEATVRTLLATGHNLYGFNVLSCAKLAALPAFMRAVETIDPGGELKVFAWMSAHAGRGSGEYCKDYVDAAGDVSWALVATTLAKVSLAHPRLVGYNLDDFYVTMSQPCGDAAACGQANLPSGRPLNKSAIADAYSAMKKVNPKFAFWPAIYFQELGLAYSGGFVFGATQFVPFDNLTSATLRLGYKGPAIPTARLSFRYASMYAARGNEWIDRIFMSVTACGQEVLRADMMALGASSDLAASGTSVFAGNISLACSAASVEFKLFSPNPLNDNFFAHKIANVFLLSLKGPDGRVRTYLLAGPGYFVHFVAD